MHCERNEKFGELMYTGKERGSLPLWKMKMNNDRETWIFSYYWRASSGMMKEKFKKTFCSETPYTAEWNALSLALPFSNVLICNLEKAWLAFSLFISSCFPALQPLSLIQGSNTGKSSFNASVRSAAASFHPWLSSQKLLNNILFRSTLCRLETSE